MARILGIDPGQDVALCLIADAANGGTHAWMVKSPGKGVDEQGLCDAVARAAPDRAIVERVGVMPGQGMSSSSTFMVSWGIIRGILVGRGVPYTLVSPIAWKNKVLAGADMGPPIPKDDEPELATRVKAAKAARKEAQKAAAVAFVQRCYPGVQLIGRGCRVPNHNLAEAVCLAAYGERGHG